MRILNKSLFVGLGAGIALALIVLDIWGSHLQNKISINENPWLLRPMNQLRASFRSPSLPSGHLPRPWVPGGPSQLHDGWQVRPLDGKPVALGEFKGKPVFLNFWSTSCGPCLAEMPAIEHLQESLKNQPVAFLAVALDDEQRVREFLKKHPLNVPVYVGEKYPPADIAALGYPTTYILNRKGEAVLRETGGFNWDDEQVQGFLLALAKE
jgi:thiol-disulfide isomerase/thioredoxin